MKENNLNGLNQYVLAIKKNCSLHKSMATSESYIDMCSHACKTQLDAKFLVIACS